MSDALIRPRSHVTGDVGQTTVLLQLQKWGWTSELVSSDYGEDLSCEIFVNGKRTAFHFRCQVKSFYSNKGQVRKLKNGNFSVSIASSTCFTWASSYYPIILAVYDVGEDIAYWSDVTEQVRKRIISLSTDTTSLHIEKNDLRKTRKLLESCVNRFYSKLLSVEEPEFTCNVFPVVMPQHRTVSFKEVMTFLRVNSMHGISFDYHKQSYELLPSWITAINSTSDDSLYGFEASSSVESVEDFFVNLRKSFAEFELTLDEGKWLSFIVSPIEFKEKTKISSVSNTAWSKLLTDWDCYSIIAKNCILDSEFSFKIPCGFKHEIARHSRSWDGFYSIEPSLDIAVQIYSMQATTPAFRESNSRFKQQILGKFLAWTCDKNDVETLQAELNEIGFNFIEVPEEVAPTNPNWVNGVISVPMFRPELGLIPQTDCWEEFEEGVVNLRLKEAGSIDKLPGKMGSFKINDFILSFFDRDYFKVPSKLNVLSSDYIGGMPLHHNEREILFHKFFIAHEDLLESYSQIETKLKTKLNNFINTDCTESNIHVEVIESDFEAILGITARLIPSLEVSTHDFIEKYKNDISSLFDLHSEAKNGVFESSVTEDILKLHGELYFEGDSPWGINKTEEQ
ncbi:DUF4365 domain-containing protein [Pseudoalteromonas shioyasakiensis]|uniref:DUF4365 domain-containing protein n=1 Tax=Pseudoalteromonas shioyasakiensis TaxID=1190813 RepID=UPI002551EFD9|nr:DUF4365 domain-containing protein [Pseudoalteromonas shioyasakiensis]MDK9685519.1 DUF4365 domain-containing protein [Pseudoalteromonas shioyasakiensis]